MKVSDVEVRPLTKSKGDKNLYVRPPAIEKKITESLVLSVEQIGLDCGITDPEQQGYIPSEVIVYLLRGDKIPPDHRCRERLWKVLLERVLKQIGCVRDPESPLSAREDTVRTYVIDRLVNLLLEDQEKSSSRLDFFEVRFGAAIKALETDSERKYQREKERRAPLEIDIKSGEISVKAERSAGGFDPMDPNKLDDPNYRNRLDRAINQLEPMQKNIIHLWSLGYPVESNDPKVRSISKTLGKVEKTIRNQRDKAFNTLRELLREE
ncbi:MAG: hypothetical protein BGO12_13455 [Verrucomicrobia bacterium 61-8]|nr:MAG: hypothetical protein BGO12_13455 [Verrucomicrobia bacterium 61-8]